MHFDLTSDWPAYLAMVVFIVFMVYVIIKGNAKEETAQAEPEIKKQ